MNIIIIFFGKLLSFISKKLNLGNGSTWPGHIALLINPNLISGILNNSNITIIFVTGTNGKTTTSKLIKTILESNGKSVFLNKSGANLLNGVASSLILEADIFGKIKKDFAVFEIDENSLTGVSSKVKPDYLIALDLFRDQLDRYGEIDTISKSWALVYEKIKHKTKFILNADDPQIAYLGMKDKTDSVYFGINDFSLKTEIPQHAADSILCPKCSQKLAFNPLYFSHLGNWSCPNCKLKRPTLEIEKNNVYPLEGTYNIYNVLAAVLLAKTIGISEKNINSALENFIPAFGRQEEIIVENKKIKFFLAKNPTSFNESLRTIKALGAKQLLIVLNDRIPDGRDVSWIWDVDFEIFVNSKIKIFTAGDRAWDITLRLKYAKLQSGIFENLNEAVTESLKSVSEGDTLFVLPTYSAMLDTRKILTGKKIL